MIVAIAFAVLGGSLAFRFQPQNGAQRLTYRGALGLRVSAGLAFGAVYTYWVGQGDTLHFFQQAQALRDLALSSPTEYLSYLTESQFPHYESASRDGFFAKLLSLVLLISGGSYWMATLWFSLGAFAAAWFLAHVLSMGFTQHREAAVLAFLGLPSLLFWSSGVLKETVLIGSLFYLFAIAVLYDRGDSIRWQHGLLMVLCLFFLIKMRYFLFGAVFLLYLILIFRKVTQSAIPSQIIWPTMAVIAVVSIYWVSKLNYNLNFNHLPQSVYDNYVTIYQNSSPGHALTFPAFEPTWLSLLLHLPLGLFAGFFRPFFGEGSPYVFMSQIESVVLLSLVVWSAFLILKGKVQSRPPFLFWLALGYVVVLASLMPLASPNFGTLMRYRTAYLPICFYLAGLLPFSVFSQKKGRIA